MPHPGGVAFCFGNGLFIYFILIPNVRAAYLDPRLRWWETKPRYRLNEKIEITALELEHSPEDSVINNFSEGGVFLSTKADIPLGLVANLNFSILETPFQLKGKIVHQVASINAYGIQFCDLTKTEKKALKNICLELRANKCRQPVHPQSGNSRTGWSLSCVGYYCPIR